MSRSSDIICRIGGDELAILTPATGLPEAFRLAERIGQAVRGEPVVVDKGELHVTLSIGLAQLEPADESVEDMVRRADVGLYRAKAAGRDCTMLGCNPPAEQPMAASA